MSASLIQLLLAALLSAMLPAVDALCHGDQRPVQRLLLHRVLAPTAREQDTVDRHKNQPRKREEMPCRRLMTRPRFRHSRLRLRRGVKPGNAPRALGQHANSPSVILILDGILLGAFMAVATNNGLRKLQSATQRARPLS